MDIHSWSNWHFSHQQPIFRAWMNLAACVCFMEPCASQSVIGTNAEKSSSKPRHSVFAHTRKAILERLGEPDVRIKKRHFVLVHDGGHGAWCWYRTADLLENAGHRATVFDLAGSGLHPADPNHISSFEEYIQPLIRVLQSLAQSEKVVLVGHGLGGLGLAYAAERFPSKIAVAVYLAGVMPPRGVQCADEHRQLAKMMEENEKKMEVVAGNGAENTAASIFFTREACREILFNTSPSHDIQLASTLLRAIPKAARQAKFETTDTGYGSVPRVYVQATKDRAWPLGAQEAMIKMNPPHRILSLVSDHSPFFSAPLDLHRTLLGIAMSYDT